MKQGQSALLSYALYTGIAFSAIYLVISTGQPYLQQMQETAAIQQHMDDIAELAQLVETVARRGTGTQLLHTIRIDQGELIVRNETIMYRIQTGSGIISAGSLRRIGNIRLSANAQTSVNLTTVNGTRCYRMQNQYLATCIRKYGTNTSFEQATLEDAVLFLRNRRLDRQFPVNSSLALDGAATGTALVSTRPLATGQHLGTGHIALLVKPPDRPTYTLHIKLRSGSDFLQVEVR
ncbi:MAG: hypothetical protein SV186_04965 [Candidatus Nanohaloarchaea archaeon]|nr:hypothetical protein [Candidatus Nanohaloarchaea archaeon]